MHGNLRVCVDNSFESTIAIDLSARLASLSGSRVTGLHVYAAKLHNDRFSQMEATLPARYRVKLFYQPPKDNRQLFEIFDYFSCQQSPVFSAKLLDNRHLAVHHLMDKADIVVLAGFIKPVLP